MWEHNMFISNQLTQISALVGLFLPLVIAFVQRQHWRNSIRVAVGVGACAVASIIVSYTKGSLNLHDLGTSAFIIFTLTKTTYLAVWKPSGATGKIETATGGGVSPTTNPDFVLPAP